MAAKEKYYISGRLSWIDVLKGIGIIYVVIGHIFINNVVYNWIYSFHMPLFFFAAGYVYQKRAISMDLKRRTQTIIIPYLTFGLLCLSYWVLIERKFRDSRLDSKSVLMGLLLGRYDFLDFNVHLWFLPCFFLTTILFNILINALGFFLNKQKVEMYIQRQKWLTKAFEIIILASTNFILSWYMLTGGAMWFITVS